MKRRAILTMMIAVTILSSLSTGCGSKKAEEEPSAAVADTFSDADKTQKKDTAAGILTLKDGMADQAPDADSTAEILQARSRKDEKGNQADTKTENADADSRSAAAAPDANDGKTSQNSAAQSNKRGSAQNTQQDSRQNAAQNTAQNSQQGTTQNNTVQNTTQNSIVPNNSQNTAQNNTLQNSSQNTAQNNTLQNNSQNTAQNNTLQDNKNQAAAKPAPNTPAAKPDKPAAAVTEKPNQAHTHTWAGHTVTSKVWIPNIVTVPDYEPKEICVWVCNCGAVLDMEDESDYFEWDTGWGIVSDTNAVENHAMRHIFAGEPDNGFNEMRTVQIQTGSHEEDQGHYETQTSVDYVYCTGCGERK